MADGATTGTLELLERSGELAALTEALAAVTAPGEGRLVLVSGEAGIGKTALVRAFCGARRRAGLSGACERAATPRPLGPLLDIAVETAGELAASGRRGGAPGEVARGRCSPSCASPTVLVLEDLHWADEATLDVLRLLAAAWRACPRSCRHPPRRRRRRTRCASCSATCPRARSTRLPLRRCSARPSASSPRPHGVDARELTERTAATRSTSPRCSRRAARSRHRARRGARARRAPARRARRCSTPWRSRRRAPSSGCWRRSPTASWTRLDECLASGDAARRGRRGRVPPRDRARGGRGGAGARPAARPCTARALAALAAAGRAAGPRAARPPRRGRRRRATPCSRYAPAAGERARRARRPPRGGRAVRPRAAVRATGCRPSSRPSCSSAARTSATSPTTIDEAIDARRAALDSYRASWATALARATAPLALAAVLVRGRQRGGRAEARAGGRGARAAAARARAGDGLQQHGAAADAGRATPPGAATGASARWRWPSGSTATEIARPRAQQRRHRRV